jgi:hypothetical protein
MLIAFGSWRSPTCVHLKRTVIVNNDSRIFLLGIKTVQLVVYSTMGYQLYTLAERESTGVICDLSFYNIQNDKKSLCTRRLQYRNTQKYFKQFQSLTMIT